MLLLYTDFLIFIAHNDFLMFVLCVDSLMFISLPVRDSLLKIVIKNPKGKIGLVHTRIYILVYTSKYIHGVDYRPHNSNDAPTYE